MPKPRRGMNRRTFLKTTGGIALAAATISPWQSLNQAHAALTIDDKMAGPLRSAHPYEIHPMLTTRVDSFPMALFTYLHNFDKFISIGVGFFYIKGVSGQHIIVDTGSPDITFKAFGFDAKSVATPDERLAELGLKPSDIDMVILTQIHFDHVEYLKLFQNAKVVVQRSELEGNAPPSTAGFIIEDFYKGANFVVVEGDVELFPGLWVLHTPGHSMGGQSVLLDTKGGRQIILGLCCGQENVENRMTPGIHVNLMDARNSLIRVVEMADTVITMHDLNDFERVYR